MFPAGTFFSPVSGMDIKKTPYCFFHQWINKKRQADRRAIVSTERENAVVGGPFPSRWKRRFPGPMGNRDNNARKAARKPSGNCPGRRAGSLTPEGPFIDLGGNCIWSFGPALLWQPPGKNRAALVVRARYGHNLKGHVLSWQCLAAQEGTSDARSSTSFSMPLRFKARTWQGAYMNRGASYAFQKQGTEMLSKDSARPSSLDPNGPPGLFQKPRPVLLYKKGPRKGQARKVLSPGKFRPKPGSSALSALISASAGMMIRERPQAEIAKTLGRPSLRLKSRQVS